MVPVWVWILLWIFLFANFAFGVYYAIRHGLDALTKVGKTGAELGDVLSRFEAADNPRAAEDSAPFFTRPLSDVSDRYAQTRQAVEERHIERDNRRADVRKRWDSYTQSDLEQIVETIEETARTSDERADFVE